MKSFSFPDTLLGNNSGIRTAFASHKKQFLITQKLTFLFAMARSVLFIVVSQNCGNVFGWKQEQRTKNENQFIFGHIHRFIILLGIGPR
jgi:hypothetical protein